MTDQKRERERSFRARKEANRPPHGQVKSFDKLLEEAGKK